MINFSQKGDFSKLDTYLERLKRGFNISSLDKYGRAGVKALSAATPVDTGLTADSWYYKIEKVDGKLTLGFYNSNKSQGALVAILLQYGHATATGGWVEGMDYINPAIQPLFENIADEAWKEVNSK